jgi:hypothetical protein
VATPLVTVPDMPNTLESDLPLDFLTFLRHADFRVNLAANLAGALLLAELMMLELDG